MAASSPCSSTSLTFSASCAATASADRQSDTDQGLWRPPSEALIASHRLQFRLSEQHSEHLAEIVAAPQHETALRHHRIGTLPARQPRRLLDPVERHLAGPPEHREHRRLPPEIDRIVAPLPLRHLPPVETEDLEQFLTVERDSPLARCPGVVLLPRAARDLRGEPNYPLGVVQGLVPRRGERPKTSTDARLH